MFKKIFSLIIVGFLLTVFGFAMGPTAQTQPANPANVYAKELLIADFDSGIISANPTWWQFGKIKTGFLEATAPANGMYTLQVTGSADNYYVGGMGTYLGKDASDFNYFVVSVYGNGPDSGTIKFQLYDDDNGNYQLEQDANFEPLYDDRFEYELSVTWQGWRTVEIPISKFVDTNPGLGDDIWNPNQKNGSGGLLQFQMVFSATSEKGNINIGLDNIKLIKKAE